MIRLMYGLAAWLAGSAVAYVLASVAHTQRVLAGLAGLGVDIGVEERIDTTVGDLAGLTVYAFVIAVALAGGLLVLSTPPFRPLPLWVRGATAGGVGIGVALFAMKSLTGFTPIAGAREPAGFMLQCLAGAIGGAVAALGWGVLRVRVPGR